MDPMASLLRASEHNLTHLNSTSQTWGWESLASVGMGICAAVGLPSNVVVIIIICGQTFRKNLSFTPKLMLNLAVCDILSLVTIPFCIYVSLKGWSFGEDLCKLFTYLLYWSLYASVLTVSSMSIHHRHIMNMRISNLKLMNRLWSQRYCFWLVAIWGLSCVLALPVTVTRSVVFRHGKFRCQRHAASSGLKVFSLVYETLLGYVIPLSVILLCYISLHKVSKTCRSKKQRTTKLVVSIVVVFFLFWTPTHIVHILDIITTLTGNQKVKAIRLLVGDFAKSLSFVNCCLDPFLYALASKGRRRQGADKVTKC